MQPGIKVKNYMMLSARTGAAHRLLFCKQADYGARRRALRKQSGGLFLARSGETGTVVKTTVVEP